MTRAFYWFGVAPSTSERNKRIEQNNKEPAEKVAHTPIDTKISFLDHGIIQGSLGLFLNFFTRRRRKIILVTGFVQRKKCFWWAKFRITLACMPVTWFAQSVSDVISNFFVAWIAFMKPKGRVFLPQDTGTALRMRSTV